MRVRAFDFVLALALLAPAAWAEETAKPVVAEVKVVGGQTISAETVEYYLGVAEGDAYDAAAVAANFHRFWDSGLVEDLKVETEELGRRQGQAHRHGQRAAQGHRVGVQGQQEDVRPRRSRRSSTPTACRSGATCRCKLRAAAASAGDPRRLRQRGVRQRHGRPEGRGVGHRTRKKVTFQIDEGAKIRIGKIQFEGNEVYSDWRLRHAMKKLKQKALWRPFGKKLIWSKESWGEDSENVKKFYMNRGYKDILVGEPKVDLVARNPKGATQKQKKFRMIVSVPVQEGRQFRLGSLELTGNTVFPETKLRKVYEGIKTGKIYNYGADREGQRGGAQPLPVARLHLRIHQPAGHRAQGPSPAWPTSRSSIYEGDRYRLGRLEFTGNAKTQDKVLRREFRLFEGDWMDMGDLPQVRVQGQPARVLQAHRRPAGVQVRRGEEAGQRDGQGPGGRPHRHPVRRRLLGDRPLLRPVHVQHPQLPRPRRDARRRRSRRARARTPTRCRSPSRTSSTAGWSSAARSTSRDHEPRRLRSRTPRAARSSGGSGRRLLRSVLDRLRVRRRVCEVHVVRHARSPGPSRRSRTSGRSPRRTPTCRCPTCLFDTYSGVTSSVTPSFGVRLPRRPVRPQPGGVATSARLRVAGGVLGGDFNYFRPEVGDSGVLPADAALHSGRQRRGGPDLPRSRLGDPDLRPLPPRRRALAARLRVLLGAAAHQGRRLLHDRYGRAESAATATCSSTWSTRSSSAGRSSSSSSATSATPGTRQQGWDLGLIRYSAGRRAAHLPADVPGAAALHLRRQPRPLPGRDRRPTSSSRSAPRSDGEDRSGSPAPRPRSGKFAFGQPSKSTP